MVPTLDLRAPGVYVREVPAGPRPIEAVGTSTAGFVGVAPGPIEPSGEAVPVTSWMDFVRRFVEGGAGEPASTPLSDAVYGFFANGGGRCYVVTVAEGEPIDGGGTRRSGLSLLEQVDEIAIVAAPGYADPASYDALVSHAATMEDRVAILDPPRDVDDIDALTEVATAEVPTPPAGGAAPAGQPGGGDEAAEPAGGEGEGEGEGRAGAGGAGSGAPAPSAGGAGGGLRPPDSPYAAFYFPWLVMRDPLGRDLRVVPPSGHMAGVWARSDATRGVHKAPANEEVVSALNVTYRVTRAEQEVLNPAGVNCIRFFPDRGIRVWGARTLAGSASEWRYLNVRRLFNMLEESIALGTTWVVFEPNDFTLWKSIRRDISAFLTRVWRDGALMGRTAEEAFFVKCDEDTTPPEARDAGQVITLIGVAPVKPAEFVVFQLSQSPSGASVESVGG